MDEKAKESQDTSRFNTEKGFPEESAYPGEYIYNFKGGVQMKVGQEKNKEYCQLLHPMGSCVTIWPDGKLETIARGELKTYAKAGMTTTVDGNMDTVVSQHVKTQFGGGIHIEVTGDAGIVASGDVALSALQGSIGMQCKNFYLGASGDFNVNVGGKTQIVTSGTTDIISGDKMTENAPQIVLEADAVDLGAEGGELLHRKGDIDSDGDVATTAASKVRAV